MTSISLIPLPRKCVSVAGRFVPGDALSVFNASTDPRIQSAICSLGRSVRRVDEIGHSTLSLLFGRPVGVPKTLKPALMDDAYSLRIRPEGIAITANTDKGIFYGLTTLRQYLDGKSSVACIDISDWPDLEFRGAHLMLGGHMPPFRKLLEWVRGLAYFKLNSFTIEYDDAFTWDRFPFLKQPYSLTKDQCRSIVEAAREHFVDVIPLIDSLGHQENYLRCEQLKHLREIPGSISDLCPSNPASLKFIKDIWTEVLEVHHDARFANVTGDETFRSGKFCPRCKPYADGNRMGELFHRYYSDLTGWMLDRGFTPMMWHDMLVQYPQQLTQYDKRVVVIDWEYGSIDKPRWKSTRGLHGPLMRQDMDQQPPDIRREFEHYWIQPATAPDFTPYPYTRYWVDKGFTTIGSTAGSPCDRPMPHTGYYGRYANTRSFSEAVKKAGGFGLLHTFWSGYQTVLSSWHSIACAGDFSWHVRKENFTKHLRCFDDVYYGSGGKFVDFAQRFDSAAFSPHPPGWCLDSQLAASTDLGKLEQSAGKALASVRKNPQCMELTLAGLDYYKATRQLEHFHTHLLMRGLLPGKDKRIDLTPYANATYDQLIPDRVARLNLRPGKVISRGVSFDILPLARPNAIGLAGKHNPRWANRIDGIRVDAFCTQLYFLHTSCFTPDGEECARYEIVWDDGRIATVPVIGNENIGDWYDGPPILPDALVGWEGLIQFIELMRARIYLYRWDNPCPQTRVCRINAVSGKSGKAHVILLGITARKATGKTRIAGDPRNLAQLAKQSLRDLERNYRRMLRGRAHDSPRGSSFRDRNRSRNRQFK